MEEHRRRLGLLGRVGGRKFSSLSKSSRFPVAKYATEVRACFGLCVEDDDEDRCPGDLCYLCHGLVLRYRESSEEVRSFAFSGWGCGFVIPFWKEHTADGGCDLSAPVPASVRGRPPKKKKKKEEDVHVSLDVHFTCLGVQ